MPAFSRTGHHVGELAPVRPQAAAGPRRSAIEEVIREALSMDRLLPTPDRMRVLTTRLLAFVGAAATALEESVNDLPMDDPVRRDALAVVKEARYRRGIGPGDGYGSAMVFTRSLGQATDALVRQQRRLAHDQGGRDSVG
ncbi:DUF6415 family natural product biosynthesis protein [Streptomyces albireticuli]|uniref:Uncharacterized protein n=1 Tax=Streptomyces albireticuli TaxID=1940 RepID=A0A2A2D0U8_9ACTN|nr:DUF6415 family natural product biosynthesis protein [Streptomyces albireticuli]MCD9163559.1 DUF6415 family natural product biosynthesis protein [Streptomyces albireticuli]MCD9193055.1 DUF6415 family natural product biosynthesis protein [Streptomyces albireticuli]PAU46063.1 hypothetical protein CK936_26080 [Streptomyces albireticuli]